MMVRERRLCLGIVLLGFGASFLYSAPARPAPLTPSIELTPHRAIYDMTLDNSTAGSNVATIRGRLVFDFSGSQCEGYTLNTRLVTQIVDRDGKSLVTDMRSSSWEHGGGERFRFNTSQYLNRQLSEAVAGNAARRNDEKSLSIALVRPAKAELRLQGKAMFPTQHSIAILQAAMQGDLVLQADIYDGSEKGNKVYETTTFIGKILPPGANKTFKPVKNAETLDDLPSWPVSISYYDRSQQQESAPAYQLAFRLYANGVSRKLQIDYGNFSVNGELSGIQFFKPKDCAAKKTEAKKINRPLRARP